MNPSKWKLVCVMALLLISTVNSILSNRTQQPRQQSQKRQVSMPPTNQSLNAPPYWEYILREFVFKTISPPPPGNNELYKRLLDAPFYGGPFPIVPNDVPSVVLSRGDVYYLPNGHWLLCQEGCIDCEVCSEYTHPTVKWVLRRIKRLSAHGASRHDLQLTINPQIDGSYHMKSLWPRSYVYVTSQGQEAAYWSDKFGSHGNGAYVNLEDGVSGPSEKPNNFWRYVERDSLGERYEQGEEKNDTVGKEPLESVTRENVEDTSVAPPEEGVNEQKIVVKEPKKERPRVKLPDRKGLNVSSTSNEYGRSKMKQFVPKLILGMDQLGQKHLVHVVPADGSTNASSMNSVASNGLNATSLNQNKSAYQRMLRRIFDSLNSNRRSIENFLEPLIHAGNSNPLDEEHQLEETRNGVTGLRQLGRLYPLYDRRIRNESLLHKRWPFSLNWKRQRRKSNGFTNNTSSFNRGFNSSSHLNPEMRNVDSTLKDDSDIFRFELVNPNYRANSSSNVTRNDQKHKLAPRKFKIVVSTESTTKPSEITHQSGNVHKEYDLIKTNRNVTLKDEKKSIHFSLRNSTQ